MHTFTHAVIDFHSLYAYLESQRHLATPSLPSDHQRQEGQVAPVLHKHIVSRSYTQHRIGQL